MRNNISLSSGKKTIPSKEGKSKRHTRYSEEANWDLSNQPELSSPQVGEVGGSGVKGQDSRKGNPYGSAFYGSHLGLSRGRLSPLFHVPVEILANCKNLKWTGSSVIGFGKVMRFTPSPDPRLSKVQNLVLEAEDLLRLASSLLQLTLGDQTEEGKAKRKQVKAFYRRLHVLNFMRAVWDAALIGLQQIRHTCVNRGSQFLINSRTVRALERFKVALIVDPEQAAARIKQLATDARSWYFDGKRPTDAIFDSCRQKWMGMTFSYVSRSLPPPLKDDPDAIVQLRLRLTSEQFPEDPGWKPWLREYFSRYSPPPASLRTQPSGHAALGYPRNRGGHATAVQHLTAIGYMLAQGISPDQEYVPKFGDDFNRNWTFLGTAKFPGDKPHPLSVPKGNSYETLLGMAGMSARHQEHLVRGCFWVLDQIDLVPVLPIDAPEKGLKRRFPTASLTAVNLIQQIFRRVIDSYLVCDRRMSQGMGGSKEPQLSQGPYYSQDMSFATDLHQFWIEISAYEVLAEKDSRLLPYVPYIKKLFGAKKLLDLEKGGLTHDDILAPRLPESINALLPDWVEERETVRGKIPLSHVPVARAFLQEYCAWLTLITDSAISDVTTVGNMMGDPTSFPTMPLMSAYAAESAGHSRHDGVLTGDDALFSKFSERKRQLYEEKMEDDLHGVISKKKTFCHLTKGVFCEQPYIHGVPQPFTLLSNWVAPPAGSKGQVSWLTQPSTVATANMMVGISKKRGLWRESPYYQTYKAAFLLGIPLGAPMDFGGVSHPKYPCVSMTRHYSWLTYLSGLSRVKLLSSTGLNMVPVPYQEMRSIGAQHVIDVLERQEQAFKENESLAPLYAEAGEPLPLVSRGYSTTVYDYAGNLLRSVEEEADLSSAPLINWEFYYRDPIIADRVPSVRKAAQTFDRRVANRPAIAGKYENVRREVARKRSVCVERNIVRRPIMVNHYGLEPGNLPKRFRLHRWIEGRFDWR